MILDLLANADRYAALHPLFAKAFEFLRRKDLRLLEPGRYPIRGEDLFAIVARQDAPPPPSPPLPPSAKAGARPPAFPPPPAPSIPAPRLEAHRRYIDIQLAVVGEFPVGWSPLKACRKVAERYSRAKDIAFYDDPIASTVTITPGAFVILYPEDAHAPGSGPGKMVKVVVKVAVDARKPRRK